MENEGISEKDLQHIREEFDKHPRVVALRQEQALLKRKGRYIEAIAVGRVIKELFDETVSNFIKETAEKVSKVDLAKVKLPIDVRKMVMTLIITIFMASDIIESSVLDFNELLHKHLGDDYDLTMFNSLKDSLKKAQEELSYLNANSPYMKRAAWGDKCDNMYEMMRHKAESIITDFLKHSSTIKKH